MVEHAFLRVQGGVTPPGSGPGGGHGRLSANFFPLESGSWGQNFSTEIRELTHRFQPEIASW